jgi:nucleotide-binding universal stress UspA family protein
MYKKILAAIDTSPMSRPVFASALSLAKLTHAELALVYVFAPDELEEPMIPRLETCDEYPDMTCPGARAYIGHMNTERLKALNNLELNLLQQYACEAIAKGMSTTFFQCFADPGPAICDLARVWNADLIVIGHRGRSGLTELLLGSVSNYVVHHAPCSVHIVHPHAKIAPTESQISQMELIS